MSATYCLVERQINSTDISWIDEHIETFAFVGFTTFVVLMQLLIISLFMLCCCGIVEKCCTVVEDDETDKDEDDGIQVEWKKGDTERKNIESVCVKKKTSIGPCGLVIKYERMVDEL